MTNLKFKTVTSQRVLMQYLASFLEIERRDKHKHSVQEKYIENEKGLKRNQEEKGESEFCNKWWRCNDNHELFDYPEYNMNSKGIQREEKIAK